MAARYRPHHPHWAGQPPGLEGRRRGPARRRQNHAMTAPATRHHLAPLACLGRAAAALGIATLLASCSTQQLYHSVQGWQQQECRKLPDAAERQRCAASNATSYEDYRRQREAAQGTR
jgi:hypothetical protein